MSGWGASIREINDFWRNWLGRQDSNLGMAVPKTAALPLGDAPAAAHRAGSRRLGNWREFAKRKMAASVRRGGPRQQAAGLFDVEHFHHLAIKRGDPAAGGQGGFVGGDHGVGLGDFRFGG